MFTYAHEIGAVLQYNVNLAVPTIKIEYKM